MDVPKGASNKVDLFAAKIIEKLGIEQLDAISKQHFKNREKAQTLVNKNINKFMYIKTASSICTNIRTCRFFIFNYLIVAPFAFNASMI